jgi:hypothetical protein
MERDVEMNGEREREREKQRIKKSKMAEKKDNFYTKLGFEIYVIKLVILIINQLSVGLSD